MALFSLESKVALVTGSSQGIGLALARGLAEAGATVVLNGRRPERLESAANELRSAGLSVHAVSFDVVDEDSVRTGMRDVRNLAGPVDVLVNNAGGSARRPIWEMEFADWKRIIELNLNSAFLVSRELIPELMRRRTGCILNIGSLMSQIARRDNANYAASKGGIAMFTKALAVELGSYNIRVNGIAPGYFATPMTRPLWEDDEFNRWLEGRTPMKRWGTLEELVGTAVFLASDASTFVTGQMIYVDGGFSAAM